MAFLRVTKRSDREGWWIDGYHPYTHQRLRKIARGRTRADREEEAAHWERTLLDAWHHGKSRGAQFAEIVERFLKHEPRHPVYEKRIKRLVRALGDVAASEVNQLAVERLRDQLLPAGHMPSTVRANIIAPINAILVFGAKRGLCAPPLFDVPRNRAVEPPVIFLPDEAERIIAAAAQHLAPLLVFLFCTGARLGEALSLEWRDVDMAKEHVVFQPWKTKTGKKRVAHLPPRAIAMLASMREPHQGPVFRHGVTVRRAYSPAKSGGQIAGSFATALRRAGLDRRLHPHSTRHSWASWWYALRPDVLALKEAGGWSTMRLVEVYAHLIAPGQEAAIAAFWGLPKTPAFVNPVEARELFWSPSGHRSLRV